MQTSAKRESHSPCFIGMAFISANVVAEIVGDPWLTSWAMIPCHRSRTDYQDALHSAKPCNPVLRAPLEVGCGNAALGPGQQSGDIWKIWPASGNPVGSTNSSEKASHSTNPWNPPSPRCWDSLKSLTTSSRLWFLQGTMFDAGKTGGYFWGWSRKHQSIDHLISLKLFSPCH